MIFQNPIWRAECRAHARAMSAPMRPSAKRGEYAEAKAEEYARWLLQRDGVDLAARAEAVRLAHNAVHPPTTHGTGARRWQSPHPDAIPDDWKPSARVVWDICTAGQRPRLVVFEFATAGRDGWRRIQPKTLAVVLELDLPNWDFDPTAIDAPEAMAA